MANLITPRCSSSSLGRGSVHLVLGALDGGLSSVSEVLHSVASVQSGSDLLVGLHESLKLDVQVFVLALEHVAVSVQSTDFSLDVLVSLKQVVVAESDVVLLLSGHEELVLELSESLFSLVLLGSKLSVAGIFVLSLSLQIRLVGELTIKVSLERLSLDHES